MYISSLYLNLNIPFSVSSTTSTTRSICCTPIILNPLRNADLGAACGTHPATTTNFPNFKASSISFLQKTQITLLIKINNTKKV